jgi:hypothetical protein
MYTTWGWIVQSAKAVGSQNYQGGSEEGVTIPLPNLLAPCTDLGCVVNNITDALLKISIPIVALMIIIGGIQMITAGGNPERFTTGRKTITYAVIGFAIILLADSIISIIRNILS